MDNMISFSKRFFSAGQVPVQSNWDRRGREERDKVNVISKKKKTRGKETPVSYP